jgi:hypothetical protein
MENGRFYNIWNSDSGFQPYDLGNHQLTNEWSGIIIMVMLVSSSMDLREITYLFLMFDQ